MNFYTGLSSIEVFSAVFNLIEPYLPSISYWVGPYRMRRRQKSYRKSYSKVRQYMNHKFKRKLPHKDELFLTFMRLRLGLLSEYIAERFGISPTLSSRIFTTWIRILSKLLGHALITWLPQEAVHSNLPGVFIKAGYKKCCVILDCAEVFIERPKSLINQACTWSEYKHHNTIKFLVGISPTGYITFLSDCYGGRASDRYIVKDSGFYDLLEREDMVMADRGFQIHDELLLRFCILQVPPGARAKSQMTTDEYKKKKDIANLRIQFERAINRIKFL